MRIGIFGGTFDPFTVAHAALVQKALDCSLKLDKVFVVPTICNYYRPDKRYLFSFEEKCTIIREFLLGINGAVEIDTIEKDQDSQWRTINTVEYFRKKFPNDDLYLIIGEDSYKNFKTWFRYEDILANCELLVANRSKELTSILIDDLPARLLNLGSKFTDISSTKVRKNLIEELIEIYLGDKEAYGND